MHRALSGVGLLVRFVGCAVLALTMTGSVLAQTPVVPSGSGTLGDPYLITQLGNLVWMGDNVGASSGKYYTVQNDIDASATAGWNSGAGFDPIGSYPPYMPFRGVFNGNGKVISHLNIDRPSESFVGLFGPVGEGSFVKDLSLVGGSIAGSNYVGALVGYNSGTVSGCYVSNSVTGTNQVGGVVGESWGTVSNCHANGSVTIVGGVSVGGLVGENNGTVCESWALGSVTGSGYVGGLVGYSPSISKVIGCYASGQVLGTSNYVGGLIGASFGMVRGCYASSQVTGTRACVGGLIGYNDIGSVSNSHAMGIVTGLISVGGLVGFNYSTVGGCYATGSVTGSNNVGGLVGANSRTVRECYSTGPVTGTNSVGGLVGYNGIGGTVTNSYWDTNTTGQAASFGGGTGTNTAAMKQQATFAGWDFANVWRITETVTYPLLRSGTTPSGSGTLVSPYLISGLGNLVWMEENAGSSSGKYFTVQNRINASGASELNVGTGFSPIGSDASMFQGLFDGNRKVISGLTINRPAQGNVGLFGYVGSVGVVKNLGLEGASVTGSNEVGAIVGWNVGVVRGCHVAGSVTGYSDVGGLVGWNDAAGAVSNCYSTASVNGSYSIGGLVGINSGGALSECYADGPVTGGYYAGGLVGWNFSLSSVSNCYAAASVAGVHTLGGLIGWNDGNVSMCYALGAVTGTPALGGLVGYNGGTVNGSYWDTNTTGMATSAGGGTGTNTAAMKQQATFVGWDFDAVWRIAENRTYPLLRCFPGSTGLPWLGLLLGQ